MARKRDNTNENPKTRNGSNAFWSIRFPVEACKYKGETMKTGAFFFALLLLSVTAFGATALTQDLSTWKTVQRGGENYFESPLNGIILQSGLLDVYNYGTIKLTYQSGTVYSISASKVVNKSGLWDSFWGNDSYNQITFSEIDTSGKVIESKVYSRVRSSYPFFSTTFADNFYAVFSNQSSDSADFENITAKFHFESSRLVFESLQIRKSALEKRVGMASTGTVLGSVPQLKVETNPTSIKLTIVPVQNGWYAVYKNSTATSDPDLSKETPGNNGPWKPISGASFTQTTDFIDTDVVAGKTYYYALWYGISADANPIPNQKWANIVKVIVGQTVTPITFPVQNLKPITVSECSSVLGCKANLDYCFIQQIFGEGGECKIAISAAALQRAQSWCSDGSIPDDVYNAINSSTQLDNDQKSIACLVYSTAVKENAAFGVPPALATTLAFQESGFRNSAARREDNKSCSIGIMQLNDGGTLQESVYSGVAGTAFEKNNKTGLIRLKFLSETFQLVAGTIVDSWTKSSCNSKAANFWSSNEGDYDTAKRNILAGLWVLKDKYNQAGGRVRTGLKYGPCAYSGQQAQYNVDVTYLGWDVALRYYNGAPFTCPQNPPFDGDSRYVEHVHKKCESLFGNGSAHCKW